MKPGKNVGASPDISEQIGPRDNRWSELLEVTG